MKKIITIFGICALGATIYIFMTKEESVVKEKSTSKTAPVRPEKAPKAQEAQMVMQKVTDQQKMNLDVDVDKQMKGWEEKFDVIETEWKSKIKNLFVEELALKESVYKEYLKMKEGLDKDKVRAFDSFHKEMEAKYGASYTYNPTEQEKQFEKDIRTKYDQVLMKLIGQENFSRYLETRDRFNQDLMEKQDPDEGVILMDF